MNNERWTVRTWAVGGTQEVSQLSVEPLRPGMGTTLAELLGRMPGSPVRGSRVDRARRGARTDNDRLRLVLHGDAGVSPVRALATCVLALGERLAGWAGCPWPPPTADARQPRPSVPAEVLCSRSIGTLGLRVRTVLALQSQGIRTVADLAQTSTLALLRTPHLGRRQVQEIGDALAAIGVPMVAGAGPHRAPPD
ncbi:MAG: hypothetical protein JNN18_23890 [Rubrivivax sp.]|nr:hypothetical protein [Rubrivivax sp.]